MDKLQEKKTLINMIPDKCSLCGGKLLKGKTEFLVKVEDEIISIEEVPAYICDDCGEAYFTPEVSRKIDVVMKKFHQGKLLARPIPAGEVELTI
jgi:YgiT-type zinc finger domain-containing protein